MAVCDQLPAWRRTEDLHVCEVHIREGPATATADITGKDENEVIPRAWSACEERTSPLVKVVPPGDKVTLFRYRNSQPNKA